MCATCGCSAETADLEHDHHSHGHDGHDADAHTHSHEGGPAGHGHAGATRTVRLEHEVLARNAEFARDNAAWLSARGVTAINLMSAPGAGKTRLLEAMIARFGGSPVLSVLEGDQETERDAARIRAAGARAVQINTGTGCHLDAHDVGHALERLDPPRGSLVAIENVGNLVCPALFDLGERAKVVLLSVAEGEDKPLKYPHAFRAAQVFVLSKLDLARHVGFDVELCIRHALAVNPRLRVFRLSSATGEGLAEWCDWLRSELARAKGAAA